MFNTFCRSERVKLQHEQQPQDRLHLHAKPTTTVTAPALIQQRSLYYSTKLFVYNGHVGGLPDASIACHPADMDVYVPGTITHYVVISALLPVASFPICYNRADIIIA